MTLVHLHALRISTVAWLALKHGWARLAFALGVSATACAQTVTVWTGAVDGSFQGGGNWTAGAPANDLTSSIATFSGVAGAGTPITVASQSVAGLNFTNTANSDFTLSGGTVTLGASGLSNTLAAFVVTINSQLAGTGGVSNTTGAVLHLNGANTYTGGTSLNGGVLYLGNASALGTGTLTTTGTTTLRNGTGSSLTLSTNNPITVSGTLRYFDTLDNNLTFGTGAVTLSGSPSIDVGGAARVTITGNIGETTTSGLTKTGTGLLILPGTNTYTGATTVNGGTLVVSGTLAGASALTIATGGTVRGTGTINGPATVQSGGSLVSGFVGGNLSFGSTLTLNSGATTTFSISGTTRGTDYNGVNVAGVTTFGGDLTFNFYTGVSDGSTFDLFQLAGSSGNFNSVTASGFYSGSFVGSGGVWTLASGGQTLTFTTATGDLVVTSGSVAVPEPSSYAAIAGVAILGLTVLRRGRYPSA